MSIPMEWRTRGLSGRDAERALCLSERLLHKIHHRRPRAVACRVMVERDGWGPCSIEGPVRVCVELLIASRPPLVAERHPDEGCPGEGIDSAIQAAFGRIIAQLDAATTTMVERSGAHRKEEFLRNVFGLEPWA
ncbi:hypothetical protein [Paraliomyxa miuraensis]|uniref:hypothetical protein n=1 Tax=Paraliomyxa miuraensis TaxID=376150 RepID=UPI00224F1256|nr:hypothetical protein [Paraliomyxa miuraensis]MCX4242160.1 hypothetical protein [Paraliomyxa miuraensis]